MMDVMAMHKELQRVMKTPQPRVTSQPSPNQHPRNNRDADY
jgi:hypothetical protein